MAKEHARWAHFGFTAAFAVIFLVEACRPLTFGYRGAILQEGFGIELVRGRRQGGFHQTRDLTVAYEYEWRDGRLELRGRVRFADSLIYNFTSIRSFQLGVVFADGGRNVLASRSLTAAGWRHPEDELPFAGAVELHPEAVFMAFTYQGTASEGCRGGRRGALLEDDDCMETTFWEVPLAR